LPDLDQGLASGDAWLASTTPTKRCAGSWTLCKRPTLPRENSHSGRASSSSTPASSLTREGKEDEPSSVSRDESSLCGGLGVEPAGLLAVPSWPASELGAVTRLESKVG